VATGGLAGLICPGCRHEITIDPDLLFRGLYVIWNKNHPKKRRT
jgi:type III pantothenate kinase